MQNSKIHNLLTKGVSNIIDRVNLEKRLLSGEKIRVKFGIDPTAPKIHLGHMVPFLKLKEFQELGHRIILLFGDATAQVGDTSDKDAERPMLTRIQTRENCAVFLEKFSKVIDISKVEVYYNSEGLDAVNFAGVGELAANFSVAEMLDRDNFSKRYKAGQRISLQEFLYPIMQGYDSVAIARKYGSCDLELGGNDQYFNLLAGRTLMHSFGLPKQDIMTFDLLVGTDGKKMSKTSPNCILIDEAPQSMYQKLINVDDGLIEHYFTFATDATLEEVAVIRDRLLEGEHPNILKIELAQRVIMMYHGKPYDANDVSNIENYDLSYLNDLNMLVDNSIITSDMFTRVNSEIKLDDFIKIIGAISGKEDEISLLEVKNKIIIVDGNIQAKEILKIVLESVGEEPIIKESSYEPWIERAKELGVTIKNNIERALLLKEVIELVSQFAGFSSKDVVTNKDTSIDVFSLLKLIGFCATSGDVRNALAGKSVRVDGVVIEDPKFLVTITPDGTLIEMGKKKAKRVFL